MSIYRTPKSPYWQYDFQIKGRRFHGSTGVEGKRAAEEVERQVRQKAALGLLDDESNMSLDLAAGRWWDEVGQHRKSSRQLEHRVAIAMRLVGPNTKIRDITTRTIARAIERRRGETYARALERDGKTAKRYGLANATVNCDVVKPLQRILNRARDTWEVPGLPTIDWKALSLPEPETQIRIYGEDKQQAWLDACGPTARFALRLLLTYGLRFSELFFPVEAFIPDAPGGPALALNDRKKGAMLLPLRDDDGRQIASRVGRAQAAALPNIWIEEGPDGTLKNVTPAALQSRLRKAAKRAGVTDKRAIHGTRHHVGTTHLALTGDLKSTQQLLGHKDIKSTMLYAHALNSGLRAALNSRNSPGAPDPSADFVVPRQPTKRSG